MRPDKLTNRARRAEDLIVDVADAAALTTQERAALLQACARWNMVIDGTLHMRYTARTRSIGWKDDAATLKAVAFLERFLADDNSDVLRVRLDAGMGIVANNVLHARRLRRRSGAARLLYRARYLDRTMNVEAQWPNG